MWFMGEQVRFRSHNYRLSGGGASAPSGSRDPFKIDRRTLLAGVAGLTVGTALGYITGRLKGRRR
jgi:membrane protein DedA with SNARE-associated domain